MVLFITLLLLPRLAVLLSLRLCIRLMHARSVIARDRWIGCLLLLCLPLLGILIYLAFRNFVTRKEYRFFSETFVGQYLS